MEPAADALTRVREASIALALALAAGAALWITLAPAWRQRPGHPAPALVMPLLGGGQLSLAQQRGHAVLIDFWAPDCAPCVAELPQFERLARAAGPRFTLIGVVMSYNDPDAIRLVAARDGITYPCRAAAGRTVAEWFNALIPQTRSCTA